MTREEDVHSCPFCGFKAAEYDLLLVCSPFKLPTGVAALC